MIDQQKVKNHSNIRGIQISISSKQTKYKKQNIFINVNLFFVIFSTFLMLVFLDNQNLNKEIQMF